MNPDHFGGREEGDPGRAARVLRAEGRGPRAYSLLWAPAPALQKGRGNDDKRDGYDVADESSLLKRV